MSNIPTINFNDLKKRLEKLGFSAVRQKGSHISYHHPVYLVDVWFIRGNDGDDFGGPGDSGSLVVAEDGTAAVGLLFAVTSIGLSVIIPIETVLKYFNVSLVNGIGVG